MSEARTEAGGWRWTSPAEPGIPPGGLSRYRRNAIHGPFVHVDASGTRAALVGP